MSGILGRRQSWYERLRFAVMAVAITALLAPIVFVLPLRWMNPPTTAFMLQHLGGEENGIGSRVPYRWTDWDQISPHVGVAVIAAEDQRFLDHRGFDVESIQEALADAEQGERLRGASTISQQVAKNLFLWPGRSVVRKGLEAYVTLFVEFLWPKQRILEVYLNVAEFGDGVFGIAAASEQFFDTVPARLEVNDAALLAAVLPNPKVLRVDQPSTYVRERQAWIRAQMTQLGGSQFWDALEER